MIKHFLGGWKLSYRLVHPIECITDLCREVKAFIQRGCRGYSDSDTWGLDDYLSLWLPKALRHLVKVNHSCGSEFYDEERKDNECWKWEEILIKIAEGFEANYKLMELEFKTVIEEQQLRNKWIEGSELFIKYFNNLWD